MRKTFDINGLSSKTERDAFDLQSEMAGNETGRQKRFLSKDKRDGMKAEERRRQRDAHSRLAAMMMADLEYAALYEDTTNALNDAEDAANQALVGLNSPVMKSLSDQSVSGATMMTSIAGLPSMFATMAIARAASN